MDLDVDQDNSESFGDDEDEIDMTPAQIITLVEEAWVNEKFAPEILPHKFELVELLLGQISNMENLQDLESTVFRKTIYQLEVDRLRFLISSYLRTRLEKIETYVMHILEQENQRIQQGVNLYLTEQELKFAQDYSGALHRHFENVASPGLLREEWSKEVVKPNMQSFVFLKSKEVIKGIVIDDGTDKAVEEDDSVDLNRGSEIIISYKSVANLVKKGDVCLI